MLLSTTLPALLLATTALALPASSSSNDDPPSMAALAADPFRPHRHKNTVLLIRHGEKKRDGSVGLNEAGKRRAKCLRKLLGAQGEHNVGLILAEDYDRKTKKRRRPFETVQGLAKDLGLKVDVECEVDDPKCVRRKIDQYAREGGTGDVVVCWKHSMLHKIAHELGAKTRPYPDERYDIMWTLRNGRVVKKESERCPGLDPQHPRKHDGDLEIDATSVIDDDDEEEEEEGSAWDEYDVETSAGQWQLGGLNELD
ncbi:hypothetical protein JCM3775_004021 [Rhodotorula graminis]